MAIISRDRRSSDHQELLHTWADVFAWSRHAARCFCWQCCQELCTQTISCKSSDFPHRKISIEWTVLNRFIFSFPVVCSLLDSSHKWTSDPGRGPLREVTRTLMASLNVLKTASFLRCKMSLDDSANNLTEIVEVQLASYYTRPWYLLSIGSW